MATYKEIQGTAVQSLASNAGTIEGQIWYDTANNAFKLQAFVAAAWATGGNLSQARRFSGGAGTATAGLCVSGDGRPPSPATPTAVEEYDGSSWTSGGAIPTGRSAAHIGTGTQTAALQSGGTVGLTAPEISTSVEEYNGSSWTAGGALPAANSYATSAGLQTATTVTGSGPVSAPTVAPNTTHIQYGGSSWTSETVTPRAVGQGNAVGTQDAYYTFGGDPLPASSPAVGSLYWNGSSWATGPALPTNWAYMGSSGTYPSAVIGGGNSPSTPGNVAPSNNCAVWDGSSWTTSTGINSPRTQVASNSGGTAPTQNNAFIAGGGESPLFNATEEFTAAGVSTKTMTTS